MNMAKNDSNPKGVGVKPSDIINQHKRMAMGLPTEPMSKASTKKTPA
jgi:hypothetical protein